VISPSVKVTTLLEGQLRGKEEGFQGEPVEDPSPNFVLPAKPGATLTFWGSRLCQAQDELNAEKDPVRRAELEAKVARYESKLKEAVNE
jgi:hypothetical protein